MNPSPFLHAFLFVIALVTAGSLGAQTSESGKKASPQGDPGTAGAQTAAQARQISIDFAGGSIAQLVAMVNKLGGPGFNLIGEKEDLGMELPSFSVRNVTPIAFAMALRQLLEPRGLTVIVEQNEMFVLRRLSTMRGLEPMRFESFQLAPYLEKHSIDEIVAAIRMAWELNPQNKPDALQLKFHPPTKLLLVSGTGEAIMVASKVISTLAGAPEKTSREQYAPTPKR